VRGWERDGLGRGGAGARGGAEGVDVDYALNAWREVIEHGYEGLVTKDLASSYVGGRTLK